MDERTKQKKFIEHFIIALNESTEVQQAILSLVNNEKRFISNSGNTATNTDFENIEVLLHKNEDLYSENESLKKQLMSIQQEFDKLKQKSELLEQNAIESLNEINSFKKILLEKDRKITAHDTETKELNSQLYALQDELLQYKQSIGELVLLYRKYLEMSSNTKEQLSNIICPNNLIGFITSCSDFKNLEGLWDYNKSLIMLGTNNSELHVLEEVFDVFFKTYNSSAKNPRFIYDTTNEGDIFDDELHVKSKNSKVQGKISAVLLRGYKSAVTNNIVRKSVVTI